MPVIKVTSPFMLQFPAPPPPPADAPPATERPHHGGEVPPGAPLLMGRSERLSFPAPGEYEVDQEIADHWYTQMHLEGYQQPPMNVPSEVRIMLTVEQAKAAKADAEAAAAAKEPQPQREA
jgi:hypothetical protein